MATKAWVAKQKRREAIVTRFADIRRKLKKEKNFAALAKLPRASHRLLDARMSIRSSQSQRALELSALAMSCLQFPVAARRLELQGFVSLSPTRCVIQVQMSSDSSAVIRPSAIDRSAAFRRFAIRLSA